jgi:enoyl-CoA hydratase/carnithine racemase
VTVADTLDDTPDLLLADRPAPGVLRLRLNRPAVLNVLNLALRRRLAEVFVVADAEDETRVVVLAGHGRAFCAGADLTEYRDATPDEIVARDLGRLWDAIAACRKPVIAAVRGHALGGGCELAMHADLIVAGQGACFGQPEVLVGLMPGGGATQRLTRAAGKFQAMRLLLLGEPVGAEEALRLGLVSEVVEDDAVEARALAVATRLARGPQQAIRFIKESVIAGMQLPLQQGLELERRCFALTFAYADKTEGISARLERRAADFGGHPSAGSGRHVGTC